MPQFTIELEKTITMYMRTTVTVDAASEEEALAKIGDASDYDTNSDLDWEQYDGDTDYDEPRID